MSLSRVWNVSSLLVIVVLFLAACAPGAPSTPAAATEAAGDTSQAAAAAKTKVKIGTHAEYHPFEFVDEANQIAGFDVDLLNALAEQAGLQLEWVNTKWDGIFVALASGEFDLVASAVTITDERKQTVDFTDPYFNAGQIIAVRQGNDAIKSVDDLKQGVKVGVQLGTTGDSYISDKTESQVERFAELPMALQALGDNDVDAVVGDAPTMANYVKANPDLKAMLVGKPFTDEFYAIAVNKARPELTDALNRALADFKATGKYDQIYNKWFGPGQ